MTVQLIVLLVALAAVIFFCKNFNACVYFIVMIDVFLRIVTYLKINILRDDAFSFMGLIPADIPTLIKSFDVGMFNDILMAAYVVIYIIFEILIVSIFIRKKY